MNHGKKFSMKIINTNPFFLLILCLIGLLFTTACKKQCASSNSDADVATSSSEPNVNAPVAELIEEENTVEKNDTEESPSLEIPEKGAIEVVAELPINPGNIAVTKEGRIFVTIHHFRPAEAQLIEITGFNTYKPWPDEKWNGDFGSGPDVLNSVLGIQIDTKNRLWVIDNGLGAENQSPKLLAFDIDSGTLAFRYDFPEATGPKGSFIQDLAVDEDNGFVYLADIGGSFEPAIVVVDVNTETSRRITGHASFEAEDVDLVVEGETLVFSNADGEVVPARIAINPITLSADKETLYYGAMSGETWWSVPTGLIREDATSASIFETIKKEGAKPVSDGVSTDAENNHYFTDLGKNAITVLTPEGNLETLVQDERLSWPDALSFGEDSWLYIVVNQLHLSPKLTGGEEKGSPPYLIMRVWTGTKGIPGR